MPLPAGIDPSMLPAFNLTPEDDQPKPGPIIGGLAAGYHQLVGLGGSAIEGAGKLAGLDGVADYGKSVADNQAAVAARVGRPDLETAPWQPGGASVAPWLEYQAAKLVPTLAGYAGATALAPEAAVPAGLARLGATLPEFLGGAGMAANAAPEALAAAGRGFGKFVLGGGAFGGVTGFGQAIQSADQKPGGATQEDAMQAAAEAPLYAAAGLIEPGFLRGALGGAEGNFATRIIARTLGGAAVGGVQSGMMTGLDQTFRPDLTPQQKTSNIVDSFLSGAAVGGVFGGATGVRALKHVDANEIDTPALEQSIDQTLDLGDQNQAQNLGRVALPAPTFVTDSAGRTINASEAAPTAYGYETPLDPFGINSVRQGATALQATPVEPVAPVAPTPVEAPQAPSALPGPADISDRSAVPGSTIVVGRRNDTGQFTSDATGVEQPPVVPDDTSRAFRNLTDQQLASAGNALANKREADGKLTDQQNQIAQGIDAELAFRRSQPNRNDTLTTADVKPATEAVEQPASQLGTGEQNSAAPASKQADQTAAASAPTPVDQAAAPAPIQARIDELTNGLRLPAALKDKLSAARSEDDIQNIVHDDVIVDGKGGKMRDALAQRVGVLDDQGKPTPLADEISARKTAPGDQAPTPAADAAFQDQWKQDVQQTGQKDPAVRALNPTSESDAQTQIYQALGDKGVKSDADGLEKLAQKYGVLNDNNQLTPLALEIAKRDPIPTEDAVKAAVAQGYKGADASMFDKGVQAHIGAGEEVTGFDTSQAREAYQAGAKWAEETNSVPSGALKKYAAAPAHTVTDEQRALGQRVEVKKSSIPPEVRQGQLVNEAIDNAGLHPATHESEIAQLKSMVREGDIDGAMKGLQRVRNGDRLFEQPDRAPAEPVKGETVTRGAPRAPREAEMVPTKAATRAEAEKAISKYELGEAVKSAHAEGAIDDRTRKSLTSKLAAGKLDEVREAIPTKFSGEKALRPTDLAQRASRRDMIREIAEQHAAERIKAGEVPELQVDENGVLKGHPAQFQGSIEEQKAQAVQQRLEGKTAEQVVDMLSKHAPNGFAREVSNKIKSTMAVLKQAGIDIHFKIAHAGDNVPDQLREARGLTIDGPEGTTVWINGLDGPGATGLSYEVVQHEMLHAVTMQAIEHIEHTGDYSTRLGKAVQDLKSVAEAIQGHFSNRVKQGDLTDLEKFIQGSNALDDPHEILAWSLSSPEFQRYLDTIDYTPKQTMWGRFVDAMRNFLGLGARKDGALTEVLRASEEIMSLTPLDKELDMAGSGSGGEHQLRVGDRLAPSAVNDRATSTIKDISDLADRFAERTDLKGKLLGAQLYWADRHHITEMFAKWFQRPTGGNPLRDVELHERQRVAINAKLTQPSTDVLDRHNKLLNSDRKSGENVQRIMRSTEFPFDYSKSWKNQTEEVRKMGQLQGLHQQYHNLWRSLSPEAKGVLADFRALNDVQMLQYRSMLLHAEAVANPATGKALGLSIHETPIDKQMAEQATLNPAETRAWWVKQVNDQMTALNNHIAAEMHGQDKDTIAAKTAQYAPIREAVKETQEAITKLDTKPYFHLPRFGQFFVDWKVRDQKALSDVADALDGKGFSGIISKDSDQNHVFMRLENAAQQKALATIIDKLKTGDKDALVTDWNVGRLSDEKYSAGLLNKGLDRLVQTIQNNPALDKEARDTAVAGLRKTILDLMPESAISRVMTKRDNIPGYDSNMVRGFAQRYKIGVDSLSGTVVAPKIAQAYTDIRGMIRDAQKAPLSQVSLDQRNNMQRVADELSRRQREMAEWGHNKYLDLLSRVTSAHYLGLSPAFGFVQLSQLGVVTLPELGSQYGFVRSAREIAKATPLAFKIMAQVFSEGKKVSLTRAMDAVVTRDALVKTPGVSARMADFLMDIVGSGHIDLGGQIRELVRAAEGNEDQRFDKAMRYATSIGYYSETMSRLIAAIATHNVNDAKAPVGDVADKARHILDESLFNFSPENWGRAFGKKGFLGSATPLATKFMQYTSQLTGKLYREAHGALGGDKQAQRFLVQHLGMMTVLAGTLGLPLVTAFAAAYDKLKDEFSADGEKPTDIRSDFREYMTHVFGKGIEPLIDKGLTRAVGVDVSQRLGEQDIVPFSRFFADRRNIKDSLSDLESRSWGAPTAMISSYAEGMSKISQGDLLGGLTAALPLGLANPIKAYRMAEGQFVDAKGNVLPMDPSTRDVVVQALGFNPAQKADYSDRLGAQKTSTMLLEQQAASLRSQMVEAMKNKDTATMQVLAQKIAAFDRANPMTPASKGIASTYRRQIEQGTIATNTQQPLGVKPGTGRYTYGDIQFSNALGNQAQ